MKKQSIIYGFMIIAGSLLFSSCSTKETAKSETDKVTENNNSEVRSDTADTTMKISESAETKKKTGAGEKDEKEENEIEDND